MITTLTQSRKRTPIYQKQFIRAQKLFDAANLALVRLVEERLNLDSDTRDAINIARGSLSEAERLLIDQPSADKGDE